MRVLVVSHNYPRFDGDPAGAFVARLATGLAVRGNKVRVIVPHSSGLKRHETQGDNLEIRRFRYAPDRWERVAYTGQMHTASTRPDRFLMLVPFLVAFLWAVRATVRQWRPDVIHAHWWIPGGLAATSCGVPVLITCHGSDVRLLEVGPWVVRWLGKEVLRRAQGVTAVSRFLCSELMARLGGATHPSVLRMPIDLGGFAVGRLALKSTPPRILFAGNLVSTKAVDCLIRAVARLSREGVGTELRVLGEGPAEPALRRLADREGIGSLITWSGFLPQAAMPAEYGSATITVLPTRDNAEGLGLTLVEALAAGSAVVGSRTGGIPEVVTHGETGLMFEAGDDAQLADCLRILLHDAEFRDKLIAEGQRRIADEFGMNRAIDSTEELLRGLLAS